MGGIPVVAGSETIPTIIRTIMACSSGPKCNAPGASGGGGALFLAFSSLTEVGELAGQLTIAYTNRSSLPSFKKERNWVPLIGIVQGINAWTIKVERKVGGLCSVSLYVQ